MKHLLFLGNVILLALAIFSSFKIDKYWNQKRQVASEVYEQLQNNVAIAQTSLQIQLQVQEDSLWNLLFEQKQSLDRQHSKIDSTISFSTGLVYQSTFHKHFSESVNEMYLQFDDSEFRRLTKAAIKHEKLYSQELRDQLDVSDSKLESRIEFWNFVLLLSLGVVGISIAVCYTIKYKGEWVRKYKNKMLGVDVVHTNREERLKHSINIQKTISDNLKKAKDDAEELYRAKGKFLSVMSHEIRNPINAILGTTYLLKDQATTIEQEENIDNLHFAAQHLRSLVDNLLDLGKIEANRIELESKPLELVQIVKRVLQSYQASAQEKDIFLEINVDPSIPDQVLGDPMRISQILANLLSNAFKFTLQGKITVSLKCASVDNNKVEILFSVEDTGIGIPADKLNSIFEEFTQAQTDTASTFGGTGLGLAITRKLIELHQGEIRVESEMGKGTSFYFSIVFLKCEKEVLTNVRYSKVQKIFDLSQVTILVAEDDRINQVVLRQFLTKWQANFDLVINGAEAVKMSQEKKYDIILMDINMPEMNGIDAAKLIRNFNQYIPIVALTASAEEVVSDQNSTVSFTGIASKPFVPDELYEIIQSQVAKSKSLDA